MPASTPGRPEEPLTVALLDLDHFKDYNDKHGHQAGDLLLREATAMWSSLLGEGAMLARYGGEEFAVLFPGQRLASAHASVLELLAHTPRGATVSAGVAQWDPDTDPSAVVGFADQALYAAKRGGRNQARSAQEGIGHPAPQAQHRAPADRGPDHAVHRSAWRH